MLQISEIVRKTEEMFDLFNEHFYNMELTRPAITVSPSNFNDNLINYKSSNLKAGNHNEFSISNEACTSALFLLANPKNQR